MGYAYDYTLGACTRHMVGRRFLVPTYLVQMLYGDLLPGHHARYCNVVPVGNQYWIILKQYPSEPVLRQHQYQSASVLSTATNSTQQPYKIATREQTQYKIAVPALTVTPTA